MPSNFKTYESQSRLLAAVLASCPGLKLDFKAIAKHYGSDATASSIEHRFRPIKKQAQVIQQAVSQGHDAKELADIVKMNEKDIAKLYGESTPMGIEFQFRGIKKEAKALRDAVDKGESPLATRKPAAASSAASTPKSTKRKGIAATPSSKTASAASKRMKQEFTGSNEGGDSDEVEYETMLDTPTRPRHKTTPAAPAAVPFTPSTTAPTAVTTPGLTMEGTPDEDDFTIIDPPSQAAPLSTQNSGMYSSKEDIAWDPINDSFLGSDMIDASQHGFGGEKYIQPYSAYDDGEV